MELGYFLVGMFVMMCILPIIENCTNYINHVIALYMAKIEIKIEEMKMDFSKKYDIAEEGENPIGFCIGEELCTSNSDDDFLEEDKQ